MGWNSWDAYGLTITEQQFRANVKVLRDKLQPFGWNYAVIDEGWFFENPEDRPHPEKLHLRHRPQRPLRPRSPARFPSAVVALSLRNPPDPADASQTTSPTIQDDQPSSPSATGSTPRASNSASTSSAAFRAPPSSATCPSPAPPSTRTTPPTQTDACPWDPTNWGVKDNARRPGLVRLAPHPVRRLGRRSPQGRLHRRPPLQSSTRFA